MGLKVNTLDLWSLIKPFIGNPVTSLVYLDLISSLIQIIENNDECEIISRIDSNVQKLVNVHMEAGRDHLKNALSSDNFEDRKQWLNEAINSFVYAKAVEASPENIKAMICIAVCFSCMNYSKQADIWFQDSYQKACKRHAELIIKLRSVSAKASFWLWVDLALFTNDIHDLYVEIFAVEKQILLLGKVILTSSCEKYTEEFYFPSEIQEIQKWSVKLNQSSDTTQVILAFDSKRYICKAINLTTGKLVDPHEITATYRRNGKHLMSP